MLIPTLSNQKTPVSDLRRGLGSIDRERQDARDAQDQTETVQDSERQDAQDLFDARRDGERRDALEQNVADHQQAGKLVQANRTLEAFAYLVSHDLRAPLRAMNAYSAALLEEYGAVLDAPGRRYAERIQASEPHRRVRFTIQQPVWALADRVIIRTVLQNLLGNAWKFTSGQHSASIELGTESSGDSRLCCYVRDNGAGFDPDQAARLFTPFQRLHTAKQFAGTGTGTGIGLASVRRIIEHHGGQVQASGATGEGATFSFTLTAGNVAA